MTTHKYNNYIVSLSSIRNSTQKFEDKNKAEAYISDLVDAGISFGYRRTELTRELQPLPTPNRNGSRVSA
jgi:hypothetical protein